MFYHKKRLQYFTPPTNPDPVYAKKLQELIGGSLGKMTVQPYTLKKYNN